MCYGDYGDMGCVGLKTTVRIQPLCGNSMTGVLLYTSTVVLTEKRAVEVSYQSLWGGVELITRVIFYGVYTCVVHKEGIWPLLF